MPGRPPAQLTAALREFGRTDHARACADPAGAYSNCLAASVRCAEWLRARGIDCGLLMLSGSLEPLLDGAGRWPFCEPLECRHWTVRADSWSIDWTARQFRPRAEWPEASEMVSLAARWRLTADWACTRCAVLLTDPRHGELAPATLERGHRDIARATSGRGPFPDPRHDGTPDLLSPCGRNGTRTAARSRQPAEADRRDGQHLRRADEVVDRHVLVDRVGEQDVAGSERDRRYAGARERGPVEPRRACGDRAW
jgi:hypothetical protein